MNRFSVIYFFQKEFQHITCSTLAEAGDLLKHLFTREEYKPIGIYDAKTELFVWEPARQEQYNQATIERQGKLDDQIVQIAQTLRLQNTRSKNQAVSIAQLLPVSQA